MKNHVFKALMKSLDKRTSVKCSCGVFERMTPLHFNLNKWEKCAILNYDPIEWIQMLTKRF